MVKQELKGAEEIREVKIRGRAICEGDFLLCVPLLGANLAEIQHEIEAAGDADVFEWRMDFFRTAKQPADFSGALAKIKALAGGKLMLCTMRTATEGGMAELSAEGYAEIVSAVIEEGCDMIDLELSMDEAILAELCEKSGERGVASVISSHDFKQTPARENMEAVLKKMADFGDLPKLAVMAKSENDTAELLAAAQNVRDLAPFIVIAMGEHGKISRIVGRSFGSFMSFVAGENASAPGQMKLSEAREILEKIY